MTNRRSRRSFLATALLGGSAAATLAFTAPGCGPSYQSQRPPLDELDKRDRGLQSKDVLAASDKLAMDLLALPELNESREQWTIVVDRMEDETSGRDFRGNYDIFLRRLQTNLARQGRGRVQLIENKQRFNDLRSRELERERDEFGQGGGAESVQPDFSLYGVANDMPNRGTNYYYLSFRLTDLRRRTLVWNDDYEVRVSRD